MIKLTKTPSASNLLQIAEHLLEFRKEKYEECKVLIRFAGLSGHSFGGLLKACQYLAQNGYLQDAQNVLNNFDIDTFYHNEASLQDAFSLSANILFLRQDNAFEKAIVYMEKDLEQNRMSPEGRLNYAQALCVLGKERQGEAQVLHAYEEDPTLVNGFSRCHCTVGPLMYDLKKARIWMERDDKMGRLQNAYRVYYAFILGEMGDIKRAQKEVALFYEHHTAGRNAFTELGFRHFALTEKKFEKALSFVEKDEKLGRLTQCNPFPAALQVLTGNTEKACAMIEQNYTLTNATGSYMLMGFCDYALHNDVERLHLIASKDLTPNRLGYPQMDYLYGAIMYHCGDKEKAWHYIFKAAKRTALAEQYATNWLYRIPLLDHKMIETFISTEIGGMFSQSLKIIADNSKDI